MTLQLSEKAKELIPKARIVSLSAWKSSHSQKSNSFKLLTTQAARIADEDLQQFHSSKPTSVNTAKLLRDCLHL